MPIQTPNATPVKVSVDAPVEGTIEEVEQWQSTKYKDNDTKLPAENYTIVLRRADETFVQFIERKAAVDRQLTRMALTMDDVVDQQIKLRFFRVPMKGEAEKFHLNLVRLDGRDGVKRRPGFGQGGLSGDARAAAVQALDLEPDDDGLPF